MKLLNGLSAKPNYFAFLYKAAYPNTFFHDSAKWGTGSNALNDWIFVRRILVEFYVYRLILSSAWQTAMVCLCASLWLLISFRFCKLGFFIFIPFNLLIERQFPSLQTLDTLN